MKKLTRDDGSSPDIVADNIERLRDIFPEVFADGSVDFDALKETLGEYVDDREERYSFTWHGKSKAKQIAQMPSSGTLLPCPEESVNWDTTKNIFIEGDNLEVLKLLQKSYHRKVKMIYIDPPYNTGNEFIYPDKYQDNLDTYLKYTGQVDDEGFKLSANSETAGRYHTNWLNMMYPRLKLARNLLRDDGVIFISIGEQEIANLKKLCDEVFGDENACGVLIWEKKKKPSFLNANMGSVTDYIVCYARHRPSSPAFTAGTVEDGKKYPFNNAGNSIQVLTFPRGSVNFLCEDQTISAQDMSSGNIVTELLDELVVKDGRNVGDFRLRGEWRYSQAKLDSFVEAGAEIIISKSPFRPNYVNRSGQAKKTANLLSYRTNDVPTNEDATEEIRQLFGADVMSYPKPAGLLKYLTRAVTSENDLVLDFFAGSGTTGHGVWKQTEDDGLSRRFILVQLPEPIQAGNANDASLEFCMEHGLTPTISSICIERLRRAGAKIDRASQSNIGFRVFKLASSNVKVWDTDFQDIDGALLGAIDNIKSDRSQEDVLYELLLKYGLDLAIPVEERSIAGKKVFVLGAGALVVCLETGITLEVVNGIAALKKELEPETMRVVFKDSGFEDDVVKTNTIQVLKQAGIDDVKSL